ncbi:5'-nucleotidase SurE [Rubripirellula obstinata]|uniref:5'-nucleotidase SurE n=1 Tax=Rubripirellula obstinata TaxID=406547 RepID=A0A5B1CK24_9BACT|nr:5'/3'-nucleotidase SurE [Rubripirellula obstinata]KAA1259890.1 5'-nucleotidase SurE [Rubripirellula obstinata]
MRILLTNDDGVFAPGLAALYEQLCNLGDVVVAAPTTEQSGVGHSITYLTPLTCKSIHRSGKNGAVKYGAGKHWAWAVDGSPADCVKLSIAELFRDSPVDLVVSGINSGLNAGINVLYSGTVAAAIEGAFFGVTSVAVSLEYDEDADYDSAAAIAARVVAGIAAKPESAGKLFNLNIPTVAAAKQAAGDSPPVKIVPMGLTQYGRSYEKRADPNGRNYYWAIWSEPPQPPPEAADIVQLREGNVTLTPLQFDLTNRAMLDQMGDWTL